MTFPVPFQLVVAWHPGNTTAGTLAARIRELYHGDDPRRRGDPPGINTGELRLDVEVRRRSRPLHPWEWRGVRASGPAPLPRASGTATVVVVFVDHQFAGAPGYVAWLEDLQQQQRERCVLFPVLMTEGDSLRYAEAGGRLLSKIQGLRYDTQPEEPLRAPHLMLRIAYECCRLMAGRGPRVFLSHAKADGLPLVQSMRSLIHELAWLPYFYDVKDLAPGQDWGGELRRGVRDGALLILRTAVFDGREWCRAEVEEALLHQVPMVAVEASDGYRRDRGPAYLNNIPVLRIVDGDLFRPLETLLREQLRCLIARQLGRQLAERAGFDVARVHVAVRPPELVDLFRWERQLRQQRASLIVYPGPRLSADEHTMLQQVAQRLFRCRLVSTDEFYGVR